MNDIKAMQPTFAAVLMGLFLILSTGCSGAGNSTSERPDPNTVTREDAQRTPSRSLASLIVQRAPGINVTQTPDGRIKVRMRGNTSFTGEDQPLFVVDDVPVDPDRDGSLPGVLISEIEWIKVLKDPVDTSRYGMRGSNGVIVVKTKQGRS